MLIKKLNATTDAITQAALVSISRERARQAVSKTKLNASATEMAATKR